MTTTTASITPEEAANLWWNAVRDAYCHEGNCARPTLNPDACEGGELEANLIAAYEATKHIAYEDMPAYDDSDIHDPWNLIFSLKVREFAKVCDGKRTNDDIDESQRKFLPALNAPQDWADRWMGHTRAKMVAEIRAASDETTSHA